MRSDVKTDQILKQHCARPEAGFAAAKHNFSELGLICIRSGGGEITSSVNNSTDRSCPD